MGACLEQVERTAENDNDKASKYFQQPVVKPKLPETETNANELISKLKQQSEDNREKNLQTIKTQTAINDQVRTLYIIACVLLYMLYHINTFSYSSRHPLVRLIVPSLS